MQLVWNKLSICFSARPVFDRFAPILYKTIKTKYNQSLFGGFITSNLDEYSKVKSALNGYEGDIRVYEVASYFEEHWADFTYERFLEYEQQYDCKPIWSLIYTDRFLIEEDYDYCVKITTGYFCFFEDLFASTHYDCYYDECISTLQSYIAYLVGKRNGVEFIAQMVPRGGVDGKYHVIVNNPQQYISDFNVNYRLVAYREEEVEKATEYLFFFENNEVVPTSQLRYREEPRVTIRTLLAPIRFVKAALNPYYMDRFFYMYHNAWKHWLDVDMYFFRYKKSKKYYHCADYNKKYVYIPLHYQPENTTLVCAPKYEKQLYFIDTWAKSVPGDTLLYVKEHYTLVGNRDLGFYKELQKYPNVVLIDPWENSRKLIEHAEAVATLAGTAGFEAMLLRKLVIVSGDSLFDMGPGVVKELEPYQKYTKIVGEWTQPSREEVVKYLCEYFRCLREGCANVWIEAAYEESNVDKLANSLLAYLGKKIE